MATTSLESIEYKTLASCFDKLVTAFKAPHLTLASELFSKGIIPMEVCSKAGTVGVSDETKATWILEAALNQVQVCPGKYYDFMSLPCFSDQCFRSLHEEITAVYEALKGGVIRRKAEASQATPTLLGADESQTFPEEHSENEVQHGVKKTEDGPDDVFRCPCGHCSLDQYLDQGCPKSSSQQFPYLDVCNLDEDDKEDLMQKLLQDITDMIKSFAQLANETRNSLDKRGVSVRNLIAHALSLGAYFDGQAMQTPLLNEDVRKLQQAETAHDVFIIIQPHMSFFNHELLKHITDSKELCTNDDRKRMDEYCTKFNDFCRRKIFEVPPGAFGQSTATTKKSKRKVFAVLITKQEGERNLVFVNEAKHKIASILKLKSSTLHLHRIDEGSIMLVFSVPEFVARESFPLEPSMCEKLNSEGFHLIVPRTFNDCAESSMTCTFTKSRRFSWPRGNKEGFFEREIPKSFSHDSLSVEGDTRNFLFLYSAKQGHVEIIKALIRASTPGILTLRLCGMTALQLAAMYGHTEVVRTLLATCSQAIFDFTYDGMSALMLASKGGHTDTVQVLIDAGDNICAKDKDEKTSLMMAAQGGHTETVNALIEAGADIDVICAQHGEGKTALTMAHQGGHTETVKALIRAGAEFTDTCFLKTSRYEAVTPPAATGVGISDELFLFKRSSSRAGSMAGSSADSRCSFG